MNYRLEIDGLRALAVIPVILYHAGFEAFAGGYVGVDIFFVISGYLITSLIFHQSAVGEFSLLGFYEKRARRILPALFLVMIACIPFAYFLMKPNQLEAFSGSLLAATLFFSNFLFFLETDYFGIASELKPLLHTWSLAVEEQYYLFFPLMVILFGRGKLLSWLIVAAMLISFSLAQFGGNLSTIYPYLEKEWLWLDVPSWAFFTTPARVWEIMVGVLLGIYLFQNAKPRGVMAEIGGVLGLSFITLAFFLFDETTPHPSVVTLLPVVGTALIILCVSPGSLVGNLLSHRALVAIGLISYSAYLWHYPLFAFAKIASLDDSFFSHVSVKLFLILVTLALAGLTYRYVEQPFRDNKIVSSRQLVIVCASVAALIIVFGLIGKTTSGLKDHYYEKVIPENKYLLIDEAGLHEERAAFWSVARRYKIAQGFVEDARTKILVLGDSHAQDLAAAFETNADLFYSEYQVRRLSLSESCFAKMVAKTKLCRKMAADFAYSSLPDNADFILLSARWSTDSPDYLYSLKQWFGTNGSKVILVGRTAEFSDTPTLALKLSKKELAVSAEIANFFLAENRNDKIDNINERLRETAKVLDWPFVDRVSLGCNDNRSRCVFFSDTQQPYYSDYGHWTTGGAKHFGEQIYKLDWAGKYLQKPQ